MLAYNEKCFNEPFISDELVIGKWQCVGFHCYDQNNSEINNSDFYQYKHNEIYFLPNGEGYWIYECWTKGKICTWAGGDEPYIQHFYELVKIDNKQYMFLKTKEDDKVFVNILIKVSDKHFSVDDFAIRENVDLPFIDDDEVLGEWISVGYVENINDFNADELRSDLWMNKVIFEKEGKVTRYYADESLWNDRWTKGKLLDLTKKLASNYNFKIINDETYMFMEWKMGNFTYGHFPPTYYVLKRI